MSLCVNVNGQYIERFVLLYHKSSEGGGWVLPTINKKHYPLGSTGVLKDNMLLSRVPVDLST